MKIKLIFIFAFLTFNGFSQKKVIQLKDCIEASIKNKANIKVSNSEIEIAKLKTMDATGKYLPQLSVSYDYRYNPIIASQLLPIGQFKITPDNETRAVQFGTKWQQNAGLNLYQPVVDFSIKSRIAESKIVEKIKNFDLAIVEEELKLEVVKSFSTINVLNNKLQIHIVDTLRTYNSYKLIKEKFDEGKVLKTDMNKAIMNHNNALKILKVTQTDLIKEKIYLSFLTGIPFETLYESEVYVFPLNTSPFMKTTPFLNLNQNPTIQQFDLKNLLIDEQIKTEKSRYRPTLGIQGFIGVNQFANTFNPFLGESWFGSSNLGISAKFPINLGENRSGRLKQFLKQTDINNYQRELEQTKLQKDYAQITEDVKLLKEEIILVEKNIALMAENISVLQDKFSSGQFSAKELNLEELDLQSEKNKLLEKKANLMVKQIEQLSVSGELNTFLNSL